MDANFWTTAWDEERIGFHQATVNAELATYYPQLALPNSPTVLVPLCGKSSDMLWLYEQGASVIGVEIVTKAVEAFFAENNLPYTQDRLDGFDIYRTQGIEILRGSIFDLAPEQAQRADALYDRAALIAFPPEMQRDYAELLSRVLRRDALMVLLTMEYDAAEKIAPPFSITDHDVHLLYGERFSIRLEKESDTLDHNPRFRDRGVTRLIERVYTLGPK